jgi:hypothetical protein
MKQQDYFKAYVHAARDAEVARVMADYLSAHAEAKRKFLLLQKPKRFN